MVFVAVIIAIDYIWYLQQLDIVHWSFQIYIIVNFLLVISANPEEWTTLKILILE